MKATEQEKPSKLSLFDIGLELVEHDVEAEAARARRIEEAVEKGDMELPEMPVGMSV